MSSLHTPSTERRQERRRVPRQSVRAMRVTPVLPLTDVQVLNVCASGVAFKTRTPVYEGEHLSFHLAEHAPPVLAQVLAREDLGDGYYRVRCRCLLGNFERVV